MTPFIARLFWSDFRSYNWMRLGFPFTIPFTKWINRKCWTGGWHCWEFPYSDSFQGNSHRRSLQEMNPWPFRVSLWSCECSGIHGRFGPAVWGGGAVGNLHPRSTLVLDNGMRKKRVDFQKIPVSWCLMTSSSSKNTLPFIDEAKMGCYKFSLALAWFTSVHLRPFSHLT